MAHLRLSRTTIEHLDWQACIKKYDRVHTLFYLDPPYWQTEGYGVDFALEQYEQMAEIMREVKGKVILSINDHPDMRQAFAGFNVNAYDRFKELRQQYYIAGRSLLINNLYGPAGINFGYAIELSLKLILVVNGHKKGLRNHNIEKYYNQVVDNKYIPQLDVSPDFLKFVNERLNTRYPIMIAENMEANEEELRAYVFPIDMLHCYDDFILQLDDAIAVAIKDPRGSIGFRCCRELMTIAGRTFFHCNDHAFQRINNYITELSEFMDDGDDFDQITAMMTNEQELWNFKGLMAVRPWGPKPNWAPAAEFTFLKEGDPISSAQWVANDVGAEMYLSSVQIVLPPGEYACRLSTKVVSSEKSR